MTGGEGAGRSQHLQLRVDIETVAGFDLDGGHAFRGQYGEARARPVDQLGLAGGAGGGDGGQDAAAGARDVLVADAGQTLFEFPSAVAPVDEVGVTVDQSGGD